MEILYWNCKTPIWSNSSFIKFNPAVLTKIWQLNSETAKIWATTSQKTSHLDYEKFLLHETDDDDMLGNLNKILDQNNTFKPHWRIKVSISGQYVSEFLVQYSPNQKLLYKSL
jgi:hypothetical protein